MEPESAPDTAYMTVTPSKPTRTELRSKRQAARAKDQEQSKVMFARGPGNLHQLDRHGQYDASGKRGRNDPCWCGSGKKLKKCSHEALRTRLEAERQKMRQEHREGDCPSCKGQKGQDEATIKVPAGSKPRDISECPDCGRKVKFDQVLPPEALDKILRAATEVPPGTLIGSDGQPVGPGGTPVGVASPDGQTTVVAKAPCTCDDLTPNPDCPQHSKPVA